MELEGLPADGDGDDDSLLDGLTDGLTDDDTEELTELDGDTLLDGLTDGLADDDGDTEGDTLLLGDTEGDTELLGDTDGETELEGDPVDAYGIPAPELYIVLISASDNFFDHKLTSSMSPSKWFPTEVQYVAPRTNGDVFAVIAPLATFTVCPSEPFLYIRALSLSNVMVSICHELADQVTLRKFMSVSVLFGSAKH